ICIEAPVETDLAAKRHLMGLFSDSETKPYPSREQGRLGEQYVWHVPMGLWRPVLLEQVGHVVAEWVHCEPRVEQGDLARLALRIRLRNLDGRIMTGELAIRVGGHTFGIRDVGLQTRAEGWTFAVNGRPMFMRGANYCSEFFLDATGDELLKSDLELAQQANMDMFRVNAHVEPPALYEAADQAGLLIWQDMPITGSYVHRADARSVAFFREAVMSQAEELVHMLFNKPSVICYAVHADAPWSRSLA